MACLFCVLQNTKPRALTGPGVQRKLHPLYFELEGSGDNLVDEQHSAERCQSSGCMPMHDAYLADHTNGLIRSSSNSIACWRPKLHNTFQTSFTTRQEADLLAQSAEYIQRHHVCALSCIWYLLHCVLLQEPTSGKKHHSVSGDRQQTLEYFEILAVATVACRSTQFEFL